MRPSHRTLLLGLAVLATLNPQLPTVFAQGSDFTYQGVLTEAGAPASGIYDLRFAIYDLAADGVAVGGPVDIADFAVTNGHFTVSLNFGGAPFDGSDRWVQVAVRPGASGGAYTDLAPRQQVTSTPYAIRAANFSGTVAASQLTGTISSNNIGAGSITTTMLAAGAVGSNQLASGAVTTGALADGAVTAVKVSTVTVSTLLTALTNPAPAANDWFGWSVAALGTDRILVGADADDLSATDAGAVYLLNGNGALLTVFTNPTPAVGDFFGISVASVGTDLVLVGANHDGTGAVNAGAAYLFSTNGALLTTFTNPTPASSDSFGFSVAALSVQPRNLYSGADR